MMKTLTSSCCSKPIIERHNDVGFSCFKDLSLNRPQLCLFPSKDVARIRFLHLLSLQHKRLHPLLSSQDSQVELETVETQPEQEIPSKTVNVRFQLEKECSFGEHFFIVGDHPMLGFWDPDNAVPLTWSEGHVWTVELDVPVGVSIQFKFILKTSTGNLLWQPDPDRIFESRETETNSTIVVCEDWDKAEHQKIIEEEALTNQDGPLLNSEMAIVQDNLTPSEEELVPDINLTSPGEEHLQALSEELATGNGDPSTEKPLAIVAENISYPTEDFIANAADDGVLDLKRTNNPDDEALDISNKNVLVAEDIGDINRATEEVEGNMIAYEGNPVLVPGLGPLTTVSTEEEMLSDDENSTINALIGVDEALDHNLSEHNNIQLDEKPEPEGEQPEEETTAVAKDDEEQPNQHIQEPPVAKEELPDVEPFHSNVLQSDVQWGRKTLQKLLNGLRFL
ncbi:hypothetical protein E1A91_A09G176500v1 [Gossypium mustelinum]|uniref:CBM20 domain-containing protein n=1 Tax=Gossypium mustelinum TaxID=34275 RepID=A0A5D2XZ32_GOSMU|nr:hypothetical protein E1A91_A09G176500v1 [Gossypium mustelinum]